MSLLLSTLVSGMDSMQVLESNLRIASNFVMMSKKEKSELLSRVKPFSKDGKFEAYKTR
jgi:predicted aldo/keto reductase-like oxidoreductase